MRCECGDTGVLFACRWLTVGARRMRARTRGPTGCSAGPCCCRSDHHPPPTTQLASHHPPPSWLVQLFPHVLHFPVRLPKCIPHYLDTSYFPKPTTLYLTQNVSPHLVGQFISSPTLQNPLSNYRNPYSNSTSHFPHSAAQLASLLLPSPIPLVSTLIANYPKIQDC